MTDTRSHQIDDLLRELRGLPDAERRVALDQRCAGDPQMRAEVEARLNRSESPTGANAPTPTVRVAASDQPPSRIGPYRIVREIGRGGQGVVYLGVREDGQSRAPAAIKVLKRGMDTDEVLRRFELERRVLDTLDHPFLARVRDWGTTEDQRPWFATEYIEGLPIDEYCDAYSLRISERLELFRKVCLAVHHAHQRLIVHRDLKPANILVTRDGEPRLLDFGIAKLLSPELSPVTVIPTAPGSRFMTPEYASPEQIRGLPLTTASDVYSLGVILYELVCGHRPYQLKRDIAGDAERVVCDVEPERPSTAAVRTETVAVPVVVGDQPTTDSRTITPEDVSRVREGRPERLRRRLAGDIDTIVLMALRKEPRRRYQSAEEFAADIKRHLEGMPVIARRDTWGYRCGKFVRRHRGGVATAAISTVVILVLLVASVWGWITAGQQRDAARTARESERVAREAEEELTQQVMDLGNTFIFEFHDAIQELDGVLPARRLLVETAVSHLENLRQRVGDRPELLREIESAYERMGDLLGGMRNPSEGRGADAMESYLQARVLLEAQAATAPDDPGLQWKIGANYLRTGDIRYQAGDLAAALDDYREVLARAEPIAAADKKYRRPRWFGLDNTAKGLHALGRWDEAYDYTVKALDQARELVDEYPDNRYYRRDLSVSLCRMGTLQREAADFDAAATLYDEAIEIRERLLSESPDSGRRKRDVVTAYLGVALTLLDGGHGERALLHIDRLMPLAAERAADNQQATRAQYDLALSHELRGRARTVTGDEHGALQDYQRLQEIVVPLCEAAPDNATYAMLRARSHQRVGDALAARGELVGAAIELRRGRALLVTLGVRTPDDPRQREALCATLETLAELARRSGDGVAADAYDVEVQTNCGRGP